MSPTSAQEAFLAIMQTVATHAAIRFRHIRCPHTRDDRIQECVCVAWKWCLRMVERGEKDPREFPAAIADYAVRHVRSGRKLAGGRSGKNDALSAHAQARGGFTVQPLPNPRAPREDTYGSVTGQRHHDALEEVLGEHDRSAVPEQVAFRIDFRQFRLSYDQRRREMIDVMMIGESTSELSERFGVSPGRVSQMRREFEAAWRSLCADV